MLPERSASTEWLFLSADVARIAGVSLRQMQWWDERKLVSPRIKDHRRVYTTEQVLGDSHSCMSPTQGSLPAENSEGSAPATSRIGATAESSSGREV